jgi:5-methylcytosine-specific restriction endonuclease McrA
MMEKTCQRRRRTTRAACPCCGRVLPLTFHHLIPKKLHRRARFRKLFSREQLNNGMQVCRQCHDGIHHRYDEMTLYREFSDPQALLLDPELNKFFIWVGRQKVADAEA